MFTLWPSYFVGGSSNSGGGRAVWTETIDRPEALRCRSGREGGSDVLVLTTGLLQTSCNLLARVARCLIELKGSRKGYEHRLTGGHVSPLSSNPTMIARRMLSNCTLDAWQSGNQCFLWSDLPTRSQVRQVTRRSETAFPLKSVGKQIHFMIKRIREVYNRIN